MKKFLIFVLLTLITATAFVGHQRVKGQDTNTSSFSETIEKKYYPINTIIRNIQIGKHDFWIPDSYKLGPYNSSDLKQKNLLLQVLLPDLEPRTRDNIKEFTEGLGWGRRSQILIHDLSQRTDIDFVFNVIIKRYPSYADLEPKFGLRHKRATNKKEGLGNLHEELFIEELNGEKESFILCRPYAKDPGCTHHFEHEGLYVKISYGKTYLEQWKQTQNKTVSLLQTFKHQPMEGN